MPNGLTQREIEALVKSVMSIDELTAILRRYIAEGRITEEEAHDIWEYVYNKVNFFIGAVRPEMEGLSPRGYREFVAKPMLTRQRLAVEAKEAEKRRQEQVELARRAAPPPIPEPYNIYAPFLEAMEAPSMRAYYERRVPAVWGEFERKFPGARQRWWLEKHKPPAPKPEPEPGMFALKFAEEHGISPTEAMRLGYGYVTGGGGALSEGEFEQLQAKPLEIRQALAWVGSEAIGEPPRPEPERRDPWLKFLEQYPFKERYLAIPPQQRGFYPARFSPYARWLTF